MSCFSLVGCGTLFFYANTSVHDIAKKLTIGVTWSIKLLSKLLRRDPPMLSTTTVDPRCIIGLRLAWLNISQV
jgi:hypothetical protein